MPPTREKDLRPRVTIVGANFAGLKAAVNLPPDFAVTVIDKNPWFEFLPNIHELVSGIKTPSMLRLPTEAVVKRAGHRFVSDTVTGIGPEENHVITRSGRKYAYDFCIIAAGGGVNTYGIKGADTHAFAFKSAGQCHRIGRKIRELSLKKAPFSITIVGGGLEGVEALGEILRKYRKIKGLRIRVVEREQHILNEAPADIESEVRKHCRPYRVEFLTGALVEEVTPHSVRMANGEDLPSDVTIWTGGAIPHPLFKASGFSETTLQWPPVNRSLQHHAHGNVFFAGDAAGLPHPLSKQAYHAMDMGRCAAENISRLASGKALKPFKPAAKPTIIAFGDLDTYLMAGGMVIAGTALSFLKEAVFQMVMTEFDPTGVLMKAYHLSNRSALSALNIGLPLAFSPTALLRLGKIRILPRRSAAGE